MLLGAWGVCRELAEACWPAERFAPTRPRPIASPPAPSPAQAHLRPPHRLPVFRAGVRHTRTPPQPPGAGRACWSAEALRADPVPPGLSPGVITLGTPRPPRPQNSPQARRAGRGGRAPHEPRPNAVVRAEAVEIVLKPREHRRAGGRSPPPGPGFAGAAAGIGAWGAPVPRPLGREPGQATPSSTGETADAARTGPETTARSRTPRPTPHQPRATQPEPPTSHPGAGTGPEAPLPRAPSTTSSRQQSQPP